MRTLFLLPLAALALTACGGAQNETAEANEILGGDSNTMGEAVSDVEAANAAADPASNETENGYADLADNEAEALGNEIEE